MNILITGSASGIGLACAQHFAEHNVTSIDKHEVDLSNTSEISQFLENNNEFDVMIYCAGIREIEQPHLMPLETWNQVLSINLTASFLLSQGLIKKALITKKSLSIINISSVSGFQAELDRAAYVSSKFALLGLTKQIAYQYGQYGIRANAIAPGIIETPLTGHYFADTTMASRIRENIPVGYWGQVGDIIPLVDVCITNQYLNGSVLVCDGGWTVGRSI